MTVFPAVEAETTHEERDPNGIAHGDTNHLSTRPLATNRLKGHCESLSLHPDQQDICPPDRHDERVWARSPSPLEHLWMFETPKRLAYVMT